MSTPVPGYDCTIDELMVVTFSRAMANDTRAFNGAVSFIPVCGYMLARRTHAPELVWAASSIAVDADPDEIGDSTLSDSLWGGASMLSNSPSTSGAMPRAPATTRSPFGGRRWTPTAT